MALTPLGEQAARRLDRAREAGIDRLMTGWEPDKNPDLRRLLGQVTTTLVATDRPPQQDGAASPGRPGGRISALTDHRDVRLTRAMGRTPGAAAR